MTYMGQPYYPQWLDNLADDVTLEAAAMDGAAQGADAVRTILVKAREQYKQQTFNYAGLLERIVSLRTTPVRCVACQLMSWFW